MPPDDDKLIAAFKGMGRVGSAIVTAAVILATGIFAALMPRAENWLLPVFQQNIIDNVERKGQKLCWDRRGYKNRAPVVNNIDVIVDYVSPLTGRLVHQTPGVFLAENGEELTTEDVPEAHKPFLRRVCLNLSSHIKPDRPVRVRQTAYFQSVTGLYDVPISFPMIVDPPDSVEQFAKLHDTREGPRGNDDDAVAGPPPAGYKPPETAPMPPEKRSEAPAGEIVEGVLVPDPGPRAYPIRLYLAVTPEMAEDIERSRIAAGEQHKVDAVRRLLAKALDAENKSAAEPYRPGR